jgi:hypothetical protein
MKRVRIEIEENDISESFWVKEHQRIVTELAERKTRRELKKVQKRERLRLERLRAAATTPADSYLTKLMNEAATARRLARDAKAYETEVWGKLSRYLTDGTRDDGKKPRIRIIENDADAAAQGQQGAR